MTHLRRAVERIEGRPAKAGAGAHAPARLSLNRPLDRALGGGLSGDGLHEIVPAAPADGAAAMGFALALAARFLARSPTSGLIVTEDFTAIELGRLYGPGLAAQGLDLERLVFVRAPDAPAVFQAMEDALRSGAPAMVLGELWRLKTYDLALSRRLLLAARAGGLPALLVLASAYGAAETVSSAAETRFEVAAAASAHLASAGGGRGLPGRPSFAARLVKARIHSAQGPPAGLDRARIVRLTWRSEDQSFDEPAISLPLAAATDDRSRQARA